jgi:hypothetical protein
MAPLSALKSGFCWCRPSNRKTPLHASGVLIEASSIDELYEIVWNCCFKLQSSTKSSFKFVLPCFRGFPPQQDQSHLFLAIQRRRLSLGTPTLKRAPLTSTDKMETLTVQGDKKSPEIIRATFEGKSIVTRCNKYVVHVQCKYCNIYINIYILITHAYKCVLESFKYFRPRPKKNEKYWTTFDQLLASARCPETSPWDQAEQVSAWHCVTGDGQYTFGTFENPKRFRSMKPVTGLRPLTSLD